MPYSFLTTGWQDSVRNICGVSVNDVSNALLEDDLYATESEDHVKEEIPNWEDIKVGKATELRRGTIYHIAAKVCNYLGKKLAKSETIGDFRYDLQDIDWGLEAFNNLQRSYVYLELAQAGTVKVLTVIDKISPYPPIYDEIVVLGDE